MGTITQNIEKLNCHSKPEILASLRREQIAAKENKIDYKMNL